MREVNIESEKVSMNEYRQWIFGYPKDHDPFEQSNYYGIADRLETKQIMWL
jgi:hypothetical protein